MNRSASASTPAPRRCAVRLAALLAAALAAGGAQAHGYGHHGHGGGHWAGHGARHGGAWLGLSIGGHHRHRRHHHGSRVQFSYVAPLYVAPRRVYREPVVRWREPVVVVERTPLPDMPVFEYRPLHEQDAARTDADRRECERLAWRAARPDPRAGGTRVVRTVRRVDAGAYRAGGPLPQAAGGAALGALGGAIAGDAGAGAAIGALAGAVSWALGSASRPRGYDEEVTTVTGYVAPRGPEPDALRVLLAGCMQSRGYQVR